MSNISSKRAPGPIGNWLLSGSNGSLGWPSTRDDEGFRALDRDGRQPRGRRAAKTQPHPRAGPGVEFQRRGRAVGEHEAALAPASSADGGIGEIVLDLAARVDVPVGQHDRRVQVDVRRLRLVDDDRPEKPASLLRGVGQAGMRQVEIEAGIGGDEADFGARAGLERFLREAADAGGRVRRPQARKAQRRRLGEPVGEPQLQLLALPEPDERARNRASIGESRRRFGRGRGELKRRRRGFEAEKPSPAEAGASARAARAEAPRGRRKAAAQGPRAGSGVTHLSHSGAPRAAPRMLANGLRRRGPIHA